MILTGAKLEEIGRQLYGDSWALVLSERLKKSRMTIFRWRDGAPMPAILKRQLAQLVEDQLATLQNIGVDLNEDVTEF